MKRFPAVQALPPGFEAEVDTFDEDAWHQIVRSFRDANIYQTWSYEGARSSFPRLSHLVLRRKGCPVAAVQCRLMPVPLMDTHIAYVRWGPMWRRWKEEQDTSTFRAALRAIRNEYVVRRGCVLRILPLLFTHNREPFLTHLQEEGFRWLSRMHQERTLILDIRPSTEQLRKNLRQKWRNMLNGAQRGNLEFQDGPGDEHFERFIAIYDQMHERKRFIETTDIHHFRRIQRDLPDDMKMHVLLCTSEGHPCAGIVLTAIGETGLYLFGATSDFGLKTRGSYALQWQAVQWLKARGCSHYDLHGINPKKNPGTYNFKEGLCGTNGRDLTFLGQFQACASSLGALVGAAANLAKGGQYAIRRVSSALRRP